MVVVVKMSVVSRGGHIQQASSPARDRRWQRYRRTRHGDTLVVRLES